MHPVIPVLQLLNAVSPVEGRKKMQKTVHILQELGAPFQERFEYSFYGMYSAQLKAELDALEREGLVKESDPPEGSKPYIIEIQPKATVLLTTIGFTENPPWIDLAKTLNEQSAQVLEGMSTILFLRRAEKDEAAVRSRLLSLKPHLEEDVDTCFDEVNRLPALA
jgi:uncharacterized protein YwgA